MLYGVDYGDLRRLSKVCEVDYGDCRKDYASSTTEIDGDYQKFGDFIILIMEIAENKLKDHSALIIEIAKNLQRVLEIVSP